LQQLIRSCNTFRTVGAGHHGISSRLKRGVLRSMPQEVNPSELNRGEKNRKYRQRHQREFDRAGAGSIGGSMTASRTLQPKALMVKCVLFVHSYLFRKLATS
jgi:hypothetical protein